LQRGFGGKSFLSAASGLEPTITSSISLAHPSLPASATPPDRGVQPLDDGLGRSDRCMKLNQELVTSGKPCSVKVATSGYAASRLSPVTGEQLGYLVAEAARDDAGGKECHLHVVPDSPCR